VTAAGWVGARFSGCGIVAPSRARVPTVGAARARERKNPKEPPNMLASDAQDRLAELGEQLAQLRGYL